MPGAFAKRLAKMKKGWDAGKENPVQFGSNLPDGMYNFRVKSAELGESNNGRLQIDYAFEVTEGEMKGEVHHEYDGLDREEGMQWVQKRIADLGQEVPDDITEIEAVVAKINKSGFQFRGRIRTKDDYTHCYFVKALDGDEAAEVEEEVEEETEETPPTKKGAKASKSAAPEEPEVEVEAEAEPETEAEPEAEAEEGEVALEVGMKVTFKVKGKDVEGEILEFTDNDTMARVKVDKMVYKVKIELLEPVAGEDEPEPEPEEKKPATKKTTRKK